MKRRIMTHTIREKQKLLARVRRIQGQLAALERALENETACEQVMQLLAAARGALASLMAEVVEEHVRTHLVDQTRFPEALNAPAVAQLLDVVRAYMR
jgi:DNA-binding FrmR family transcriptional regulator